MSFYIYKERGHLYEEAALFAMIGGQNGWHFYFKCVNLCIMETRGVSVS